MEDDDVVEPVNKFGLEHLLRFLQHRSRNRFKLVFPKGLVAAKPIVVCRRKISAPTFDVIMMMVLRKSSCARVESVDFPIFQDLQQQMHHVRMRLFDFIEQDHGYGRRLTASESWPALFRSRHNQEETDQPRSVNFSCTPDMSI